MTWTVGRLWRVGNVAFALVAGCAAAGSGGGGVSVECGAEGCADGAPRELPDAETPTPDAEPAPEDTSTPEPDAMVEPDADAMAPEECAPGDTDCSCEVDAVQDCYGGDASHAGVGECHLGTARCSDNGEFGGAWEDCAGFGVPADEACNGLDDDCDGAADEGCECVPGETRACYVGPAGTRGIGACRDGVQTCDADGAWGTVCEGAALPGSESCNGLDDDCDGVADETCNCREGETMACYEGPDGTRGVGACGDGARTCVVRPDGSDFGACLGSGAPSAELCGNGLDDDCDGTADEGCVCTEGSTQACYSGPGATRGVGECRDGSQRCVTTSSGTDWGACGGDRLPGREICGDDLDNDCDGAAEEGCLCDLGADRGCYTGPAATRGVGECRDGSQTCIETSGGGTDFGSCGGDRGPTAELCGDRKDNNCDGRTDEDCDCSTAPAAMPPIVACGGSLTTRALTPVTLNATAMDDCQVASRRWTVVSGPAGSDSAFAMPDAATTSFTPQLVGTYRVRFTATDNEGLASSCEVTVVARGQGLRVELQWDIAGDVDLHMLSSAGTGWFSSPNDCYYLNMTPSWDAPGLGDDPRLDIDDIPGDGPENINVDVPVMGQTYRVGVHHYRTDSTARSATVRIYCGDISLTPVATYTRTVRGNGGGDARDFWKVVDVTWTGEDSCTVAPLESVVTTAESRMAR